MKTNVVLNQTDIIVLAVIAVLMIFGVRLIFGFFHEGKKKLSPSMDTYNGKGKVKLTVEVSGMMCNMCETHINDIVRKNFSVKKVTSSHTKGETVIVADHMIDEKKLKDSIESLGYTVTEIQAANA
ncbi:MAG: heavy-metal-associated domain-containing protein [Bulleidia sp.]